MKNTIRKKNNEKTFNKEKNLKNNQTNLFLEKWSWEFQSMKNSNFQSQQKIHQRFNTNSLKKKKWKSECVNETKKW
jgi:hypothetical protein